MDTEPHEDPEHLSSSKENIPPTQPQPPSAVFPVHPNSLPVSGGHPLNPSKRPAPSEDLKSLASNKRQLSAGTQTYEQRVLQEKIFGNKAAKVEDFKTFVNWDDTLKDEEASWDEPVGKAELDWLIQSIPLEDRVGEQADLDETVMVNKTAEVMADLRLPHSSNVDRISWETLLCLG
jgi:hypothetical protein